jgi:hypothetical protein
MQIARCARSVDVVEVVHEIHHGKVGGDHAARATGE